MSAVIREHIEKIKQRLTRQVALSQTQTPSRPSWISGKGAIIIALLLVALTGTYLVLSSRSAEASPQPGVLVSFDSGNHALVTPSYVNGGQIVMSWDQIEPAQGVFCWDNPQPSPHTVHACGSSTTNGLGSLLQYYHGQGKNVTVQVNSKNRPDWVYASGSGVKYCGYVSDPIYTAKFDVSQFWNPDGSLNDTYFNMLNSMFSSLAARLSADPNIGIVSGVRLSPLLIGTEFYLLSSGLYTYYPDTSNPQFSSDCANGALSVNTSNHAYATTMMNEYNILQAKGIRSIMRKTGFYALGSYNLSTTMLHTGSPQPWFFETASNPDKNYESKDPFTYAQVRNYTGSGLPAVSFAEAVAESSYASSTGATRIYNPTSWNYWNILMNLDRGTSYMAVFGKDIAEAQKPNAEYVAAFTFADKYATYNYPSKAGVSPGAWIAFAPDSAGGQTWTKGNFSMFMTEDTTDGSVGLDSLGAYSGTHCFLEAASVPRCPGVAMIGPAAQRYGRWARRTNGGAIRVTLAAGFKNSLTANPVVRVTYLNNHSGSWRLDWGSGSSTINMSGDGTWTTTGNIAIPKGFSGTLSLVPVSGGDVTFHMVEALRSGTASDTQAPTAPTNLHTTTNAYNKVSLAWTASTDNVGVAGYNILRNNVKIGTSATASYDDTTVSASTRYEYTASAFDAAGNTSPASAVVSVTTPGPPDTQAPTTPGNLKAVVVNAAQINLTWSAATDNVGVVGYNIYRNGSTTPLVSVPGLNYSDVQVSANTTYSYTVSAVDAAGNASPKSSPVAAQTPDVTDKQAPTVPQNLHTTVVTSTAIALAWDASTDNKGVLGYHLYRNNQLIASPNSPAYTDSNLSPDTDYTYAVSAFDASANGSAPSASLSVRTNPKDNDGGTGGLVITPPNTSPVTVAAGDIAKISGSVKIQDLNGKETKTIDTTTLTNGPHKIFGHTVIINNKLNRFERLRNRLFGFLGGMSGRILNIIIGLLLMILIAAGILGPKYAGPLWRTAQKQTRSLSNILLRNINNAKNKLRPRQKN